MKKWIIGLACLVCVVGLMGCDGADAAKASDDKSVTVLNDGNVISFDNFGFELVLETRAGNAEYDYYRDRGTNIMYVWRDSGLTYGAAGFTAMLDPETGGGLTYDRWVELHSVVTRD